MCKSHIPHNTKNKLLLLNNYEGILNRKIIDFSGETPFPSFFHSQDIFM